MPRTVLLGSSSKPSVVSNAGIWSLPVAGLFPVIILTFTSSTLVPVATMPGWLEAFANINPITVMVGALRALCLGGSTARPVGEALAWIGDLLITIPFAISRYRHATSA